MTFLKIDSEAGATGRFFTGETSPLGRGVEGLADLITSPNDPYFARVVVNRFWDKLMGRGLVDVAEGFAVERTPSHPELLDWLAVEFIDHDYDLRHILRLICNSRTYRLSSDGLPTQVSKVEGPFFERVALKRLTAEQIYDSILIVTGHDSNTGSERRAVGKRYPQPAGTFLPVFGCHDRNTFHERDDEATMGQALELFNGEFINRTIRIHPDHPLIQWQDEGCDDEATVSRMFMQFLTREPTISELDLAWSHVQLGDPVCEIDRARERDNENVAYDDSLDRRWTDIQWALINTREFMFNH